MVIANVLKLLPAWSKIMWLLLPAANVAVLLLPLTEMFPESVIAPAAVTDRSPDTVEAPRSIPFVSRIVTSLPVVITNVVKSLPA